MQSVGIIGLKNSSLLDSWHVYQALLAKQDLSEYASIYLEACLWICEDGCVNLPYSAFICICLDL